MALWITCVPTGKPGQCPAFRASLTAEEEYFEVSIVSRCFVDFQGSRSGDERKAIRFYCNSFTQLPPFLLEAENGCFLLVISHEDH